MRYLIIIFLFIQWAQADTFHSLSIDSLLKSASRIHPQTAKYKKWLFFFCTKQTDEHWRLHKDIVKTVLVHQRLDRWILVTSEEFTDTLLVRVEQPQKNQFRAAYITLDQFFQYQQYATFSIDEFALTNELFFVSQKNIDRSRSFALHIPIPGKGDTTALGNSFLFQHSPTKHCVYFDTQFSVGTWKMDCSAALNYNISIEAYQKLNETFISDSLTIYRTISDSCKRFAKCSPMEKIGITTLKKIKNRVLQEAGVSKLMREAMLCFDGTEKHSVLNGYYLLFSLGSELDPQQCIARGIGYIDFKRVVFARTDNTFLYELSPVITQVPVTNVDPEDIHKFLDR